MAAAAAAARQLQRRLLSLLATTQPHTLPTTTHTSTEFLPFLNSFFRRNDLFRRGLQTLKEPSKEAVEDVERHEACSVKPGSNLTEAPTSNADSAVKYKTVSNLKVSPRHDLAMIFTCKVCETRSMKTLSRESYEKGVVVARCGGCNNLHLIADHLGWFGEPGSIEEFLAARGEEVKKGSADTLNLTLEDLAGKKNLEI